jgi:hypothetical protein
MFTYVTFNLVVKLPPGHLRLYSTQTKISNITPIFWHTVSVGITEMLPDMTRNRKSKMVAAKPDAIISQFVDKIATKFQRLNPYFQDPPAQ